MAKPVVAIVGRPNVGKSTLFNKLIGSRLSIVDDTPGVTRDRIYGDCEWLNHKFLLVDTGGIEPNTSDVILSQMRTQAEIAISTADVIILVTNIRDGVVASDYEVATMLQKSGKPIVLCVNKCDSIGEPEPEFYEFYNLGLGDPVAVSASHGHGTGDLLDEVLKYLPECEDEEDDDEIIKVAIIGKPNVGKSSFLNCLLKEDRAIVSEYAGTTRDVIEEQFLLGGIPIVLADTAGIRETEDYVERIGVEKSRRILNEAELAIVVLDGSAPLTEEDFEILELVKGRSYVIIINKSDLGSANIKNSLTGEFKNAPVIELSAKTGAGLDVFNGWLQKFVYGSDKHLGDGIYVQNARHENLLKNSLASMQDALNAAEAQMPYDCIMIDLRNAAGFLGEITGDTVRDEIINEIFSKFCIGK